ncbi:Phorbol ester/diacylglycerol-binding protein unc-13, partial [Parelaphostrongylus tenuis]
GISEDSDYTSDVAFPIHHQLNSSAHQWDSHLHPHRYRHHHKDIASYEDEEDAYQARPDNYHQSVQHHYDNDYAVKPYDREVPLSNYECTAYDTEPTTCCLPSGNQKMSFHSQHPEDECGFDFNGCKHEECHPQLEEDHTDDVHFDLHKSTYPEQYESMEGTSGYQDDYRQQYPGDYWNEQEPLSYNSRPQQSAHVSLRWNDSVEGTDVATERDLSDHERSTFDDVEGRHSKLSCPSSLVDKNERRYDSDSSRRGSYYADESDDRRAETKAYNWRYGSIQEEDHVKENWRDDTSLEHWRIEPERKQFLWQRQIQHDEDEQYAGEGYQADREDSSRQNSIERVEAVTHHGIDIAHQTIHEEEEKRTPHELWHWAYKQVCKSLGLQRECDLTQGIFRKINSYQKFGSSFNSERGSSPLKYDRNFQNIDNIELRKTPTMNSREEEDETSSVTL